MDQSKVTLQADQITIATGGRPTIPSEDTIPGARLGIDSDGFFDLEEQPKRVAVVGAGYIAVELAGVLHTLGSETHLLIRHDKVLRTFEPVIQDTIKPWMDGKNQDRYSQEHECCQGGRGEGEDVDCAYSQRR